MISPRVRGEKCSRPLDEDGTLVAQATRGGLTDPHPALAQRLPTGASPFLIQGAEFLSLSLTYIALYDSKPKAHG
jgi:hypothetical protein